jgi:hypothetical protein
VLDELLVAARPLRVLPVASSARVASSSRRRTLRLLQVGWHPITSWTGDAPLPTWSSTWNLFHGNRRRPPPPVRDGAARDQRAGRRLPQEVPAFTHHRRVERMQMFEEVAAVRQSGRCRPASAQR